MSTKKARNSLTLKKKCELIDVAKKNPKLSSRALAARFGCGKTQVTKILSNKESIVEQFESNVSKDCILLSKRSRPCEFSEINEALYKWYSLATTRNIYPAGPQLCEKARMIADQLGANNFKASNGWLDRWKKRYDIRKIKICGESADVSGETVESWRERLPEYYTDIQLTISGIWMKPGAFGVHFRSMGLEKRGHCVREVRRQNRGLQ